MMMGGFVGVVGPGWVFGGRAGEYSCVCHDFSRVEADGWS